MFFMLIKLADLPLDLSKKIPMTLKLNRTQIETDYLPRQLAHDIEMYLDSFTNFDVFVPDKVRSTKMHDAERTKAATKALRAQPHRGTEGRSRLVPGGFGGKIRVRCRF